MIKKGDEIRILPEWQDKGDDKLIWVAVDDEENGRVMIMPVNLDLPINPQSVVKVSQIELVEAKENSTV